MAAGRLIIRPVGRQSVDQSVVGQSVVDWSVNVRSVDWSVSRPACGQLDSRQSFGESAGRSASWSVSRYLKHIDTEISAWPLKKFFCAERRSVANTYSAPNALLLFRNLQAVSMCSGMLVLLVLMRAWCLISVVHMDI